MERHSEKGSAILWILIAVALFAALNYAFNSSSRVSTSLLSDAEAEAYANEIIQYGNEVKSAIKRMQLRGCKDTEISFENSVVAGYTNPNAPVDNSCHVFDIAGGGLQWKNSENIDLVYTSSNRVGGVGIANKRDLVLVAKEVSKEICQEINKNNNIDSGGDYISEENDYYKLDKHIGIFDEGGALLSGNGSPGTSGKSFGCILSIATPPVGENTQINKYYVHYVLITK